MPAWGSSATAAAQTNLQTNITKLAPLATQWNGVQTGVAVKQITSQPAPASTSQSAVAQLFSKLGSIGKESAHIVAGVGNWAFKTGESLVTAPIRLADASFDFDKDAYDTFSYSRQQTEVTNRLQNLNSLYSTNKISTTDYKAELAQITKDNTALGKANSGLSAKVAHDGSRITNSTVDTASAVLTVLTAGAGAAAARVADAGIGAAADFLGSDAADGAMAEGEDALGRVAADKAAFDNLPSTAKSPVQNAITQVLFNGSTNLTSKQIARSAATNLLLNYPLTYSMLSGTGKQVYTELQQDKYGDAVKTSAFNALLLLSGGPIGHALEYGGKALKFSSDAVFGGISGLDELSRQLYNGDSDALYNDIKADPGLIKNVHATLQTNIDAMHGNIAQGVYRITDGLRNAGWDIENTEGKTMVTDMANWASSQRGLTQSLLDSGMAPEDAAKYAVGRWTSDDSNNVISQLTRGGLNGGEYNTEDLLNLWEQMKESTPGASWANNTAIDNLVTKAIKTSGSFSGLSSQIREADAALGVTGVPLKVGRDIARRGYVPIIPNSLEAPFKEGLGKVSTRAVSSADEFFMKTVSPLPVLGGIGKLLTNMGMNPNAAPVRVYQLFTQNLADGLKDIPSFSEVKADMVSKQIADFARQDRKLPVQDYRQFTVGEIQKATGLLKSDATQVRDAIQDAMLRVPLTVRGLGDRIADINYKINPAAKYYARLQNATRFAYNPFFQARLSYKAEFLTQLETGGKFPTLLGTNRILSTIFPEHYNQLDSVARKLEDKGLFGAGYSGEAADESAAGHQAMSGHLLSTQKRSIAGLVNSMSDRAGMTVDQFTNAFPQETKDAIQTVLKYDPRSNFLNSPLARTLNFAFFPFRFDLKVTQIMARTLTRQPAIVQFAAIKGMMQAHQYLNSPEGQAWYSENSDVIGLFTYFSPLATVSQISEALTGKPSLNNYGELGGLPFGWIPQLLNAEGITNSGTAYVNPTTGVIDKNYVPISSRGKAQSAIEDFLGALFSYPGATVGLPSKTKVDVKIAQAMIPGGSTAKDFNLVTPQATPEQQQFAQVVQGLHGTATTAVAGALTPYGSAQQTTPGMNVPAQASTANNAIPRTVPKAASSSTKKKTKAEETPYLLPGQTALGQTPQ